MNIPIYVGSKEVRIQSDDKNFMISRKQRRKDKTTGEIKEVFEAELFYSCLASCFTRILSLKISRSDATTLEKLRADVIAAREDILAVCKT